MLLFWTDQTLATHQVPLFDGVGWVTSGLQYRMQWSLAAKLPSHLLEEVEDALASDLHHRTGARATSPLPSGTNADANDAAVSAGAATASAAAAAREGLGVSVSKVDAVLATIAASQFPGQTVLFVLAPRKAKVGFHACFFYMYLSSSLFRFDAVVRCWCW